MLSETQWGEASREFFATLANDNYSSELDITLKYDGLWNCPFPYLMAWFQAPTDGQPHPESYLHAEFYPPYRTRDKLKYLAGTKLVVGMFANNALPEEKAKELQAVSVRDYAESLLLLTGILGFL